MLHEKYLRAGEAVRHGHSGQRGEGGSSPQQAPPLRLLLFPLLPAGAGGQRPARRCHRICEADLVLHETQVRHFPAHHTQPHWLKLLARFDIMDADGNVALIIEGPWCTFSCGGDVEFKVLTPDGETEVGKISKQWSGLLKEAFTDADNFGIS